MLPPTTVHLGTQYYRAPFPESRFWEDDLRQMREAGLDTVQLWVVWGWVEPAPGDFRFDDYDRLVELAGQAGLNVVLSTIAEIQPYWILREEPGCDLVDHQGHRVISVNRGETHFGCTPGGCTDHPGVWRRMSGFLDTVARRYAAAPNLVGWDAWNELRWNSEAEGRCCYCDHTVEAFRHWLKERYGSLEALNEAWKRRYPDWADVWPGRRPGLPFTEAMAWQHFLTGRANVHARRRYDVIKAADPDRPVTVHGGDPSPGYAGGYESKLTPLDRGNDWAFAEQLDGVGCSSFPKWMGMDDADFAVRIEFVKSAAGAKRVWLSELQGGRASTGFEVRQPVPARDQQRWVWNGFACGADTILFWCWRDEVFGRESGGFGIIGRDGLAEERVRELAVTGEALRRHGPLLAGYRPDPVQIGVLFSPQSYYLHWAQEGHARRAYKGLHGICRALTRRALPYRVLEDSRVTPDTLIGLDLLFLPRGTALPHDLEAPLADWIHQGGTLVTESECGAFGPEGLYRYPEDRFLNRLCGLTEVGRRALDPAAIRPRLEGTDAHVLFAQWLTPLRLPEGATSLADHPDGSLLAEVPVGEGRVIALGGYASDAYTDASGGDTGFEAFVGWTAERAGVIPGVQVLSPAPESDAFVHLRTGTAQGRRLTFVFASPRIREVWLGFAPGGLQGGPLRDLRTGEEATPTPAEDGGHQLHLTIPDIGFAVLAEEA